MQQGRVQLDADWNEQAALTARRDETTARDVVGDCGGPAGSAAFGVLPAAPAGSPAPGPGDFYLSAGRYYVEGMQCELEAPVLFTKQPDRLDVAALPAGNHLLILDVWRRHLTALQDDAIREHALGGPDTATRVKTICQVRAFAAAGAGGASPTCAAEPAGFKALIDPGTARLTAKTVAAATPTDPCLVPENGGYTGPENQFYRVEIHNPSTAPGGATWKWSRENGSVVVAVEKIDPTNAKRIFVSGVGADKETLGFKKGDFVELLDDANELESVPGQIAEVDDVDRDARVIILKTAIVRPAPGKPEGVDKTRNPLLRRWEGFAPVQLNQFKPLEFSVQVRFDGGDYRTGHYWQIPARAATARSQRGEIEWPNDGAANPQPLSLAPRGIAHHFCKLGIINVSAAPARAVTLTSDCRCLWPALTLVPRLFYVSGDGQEVMPDLPDKTGKRYKLPRPLVVGLGNGQCAPPGTTVHFNVILPGDGRVDAAPSVTTPAGQTVDLPIGADGMARCDFYLDRDNYSQQVQAQLLDAAGAPCSLPIIFNATLSVAREVAYDPSGCTALEDRKNVQDALSRLAAMVSLYKVSGDGQEGTSGGELPQPLFVLAANRCGVAAGLEVKFRVVTGGGSVTPASILTSAAAATIGLASCKWTLGPSPETQELEAVLVSNDPQRPVTEPSTVRFTANLRAQGGECCCVTVGHGGQFEQLDQAIQQLLLKDNQTDICICLMPGDHRVPTNLVIKSVDAKKPAFVRIAGCGPASRLLMENNNFSALNLASFALSDLYIIAVKKQTVTPITIEGCAQVSITGCYLTQEQESDPNDLLTIAGALRIVLANNVIESYWLQEPRRKLLGLEASARFEARTFDTLMLEVAGKLADGGDKAQREFVNAFRATLPKRRADDPRQETLDGLLKQIEAVKIRADDKSEAVAAFRVLVPQLVVAPAVVIADANADVFILNNFIIGEVRFYGLQFMLGQEIFDQVAQKIQVRKLALVPTVRDAKIEGNTLTEVTVDRKIGDAITKPSLGGIFNRMSLLNNMFYFPRNEWLAAHVNASGNHFWRENDFRVGTAAGASFICLGTGGNGSLPILRYGVPTLAGAKPPFRGGVDSNFIQVIPV